MQVKCQPFWKTPCYCIVGFPLIHTVWVVISELEKIAWCLLKISSNPTLESSLKIFFDPSLTPFLVQCLKCDETLFLVFNINLKEQIKTDLLLVSITFKLSEFQRLDKLYRLLVSSSFWFESCIWHILYTSFDSSSAGLICRMMSSIST